MNIKELLQKPYKEIGSEKFIQQIIIPIFGEENIDELNGALKEEMLDSYAELKYDASQTGIDSIKRICSVDIQFNHIDIFEISVSDKVKMSRNRVNIQRVVRRLMDTYSSAFMIFYYTNEDNWEWRFSYCSKGSNDTDSTTAKRYTFLLGPGQSCRTAAENFTKLLNKEGEIELNDIQEAFDVEALSKEFFCKYKEQYDKFVKYICNNKNFRESFINAEKRGKDLLTLNAEESYEEEKPIRDYVKKLLGRIVFLHFLQKKGWLNCSETWSDGDKDFLWNLYTYSSELQKDDFLDQVLEPLFIAIDTNRSSSENKYDTHVQLPNGSIVRIPYLNGGLFERDELDEVESRFPASYFQELLSFFREYNFTIDENDPDDSQVGVDPEMLGRIFENLLEDNKDKGAFYTPKIIVQFMCKESLYQYLVKEIKSEKYLYRREKNEVMGNKLEDLLNNSYLRDFIENHNISPIMQDRDIAEIINNSLKKIKICDPAIGSGAFPLGLLNEIFTCRRVLHDIIDKSEVFSNAEIKREIIQNNIYGTDIEKGAVDIARLRFWLALIVDEETPNSLPNLDFKIMNGNSLIESILGQDFSSFNLKRKDFNQITDFSIGLSLDENQIMASIAKLSGRYFNISDHKLKKDTENELIQLLKILISQKINPKLNNNDIQKVISNLSKESSDHFFWHVFFSDVFLDGGFDIVIGNPPYVQLSKTITSNKSIKLADLYENEKYSVFERTGDIYCLFIEKGIDLLKDKGVLCFITSNKWMRAGYGEKLREFLGKNTNPLSILDFSSTKIFENATVDVDILITTKETNKEKTLCLNVPKNCIDNLNIQLLRDGVYCNFNSGEPWVFLNSIEQNLKKKVEAKGISIAQLAKTGKLRINRGVVTGFNDAFIISGNKREEILNNCLDEEERKRTEELIRPILRGKDLKKYHYDWNDIYLIALFPSRNYDINNYPSIKSHLLSFGKEKLEQTGMSYKINGETIKSRKKTSNKWFETQDSISYWKDFFEPKICYKEIGNDMDACIVPSGIYVNNKCYMIVGENINQLLAFINSKLFKKVYFSNTNFGGGKGKVFLNTVKVLDLDKSQSDELNEIMSNENCEDKIDEFFMRLYKLTEEEKLFIIHREE